MESVCVCVVVCVYIYSLKYLETQGMPSNVGHSNCPHTHGASVLTRIENDLRSCFKVLPHHWNQLKGERIYSGLRGYSLLWWGRHRVAVAAAAGKWGCLLTLLQFRSRSRSG